MKRLFYFLLILFLGPIIGGIYGILHDQLTYTISQEYYTKFKFYQFGLIEEGQQPVFLSFRLAVAQVGFMATWWMGLPIGIILGIIGLKIKDNQKMFQTVLKAFLLTVVVAFLTGLIGLLYGKFVLAETGVDWWLPENLIDRKSFIAVGSMHNFSYLGGLIGLVAGIIYILRNGKKNAAAYNSGFAQ
jgi:hypothetical protein